METKQFRLLAKETLSEFANLGTESNKTSQGWKMTLGREWVLFICTLAGSLLLSTIIEFFTSMGVVKLTTIFFVLAYITRVTVWSIKEMGKE